MEKHDRVVNRLAAYAGIFSLLLGIPGLYFAYIQTYQSDSPTTPKLEPAQSRPAEQPSRDSITPSVITKSLLAPIPAASARNNGPDQLLAATLAELPELLVAECSSRPELNFQQEAEFEIVVKPDLARYRAFAEKLEALLVKQSTKRTTFLLKGTAHTRNNEIVPNVYYGTVSTEPAWGPPITEKNQWCIWICTSTTASDTVLRWNGYVVDTDMVTVLKNLQMPYQSISGDINRRASAATTNVAVQFVAKNGSLLSEDEFELFSGYDLTYNDAYYPDNDRDRMPLLRHFVVRRFDGKESLLSSSYSGAEQFIADRRRAENGYLQGCTANFYIAPYAFVLKRHGFEPSAGGMYYATQQVHRRRMKFSMQELSQLAEVKCGVTWRAGAN